MVRLHTAFCALAAFAMTALIAAGALAAAADNRAALAYEDNVTINTACFAATKTGSDAFRSCVEQQIAALKTHPGPDRAAVPAPQLAAAERDCRYLRLSGVAAYNDCLRQDLASAAALQDGEAEPAAAPLAAAAEPPPATNPAIIPVTAAALPLPRAVLPARPDHIARQPLSSTAVFKKIEGSVFVVIAAQSVADIRSHSFMQGSAVAVGAHLLLTNCHVVEGRPVIRLMQDRRIFTPTLAAGDFATDRCILRSAGAALVPVAGVRPFNDLVVGERVFAVGAPHSLDRSMSDGLISGLRRDRRKGEVVQTSAAISPGSSGGGLFDDRGNLVGITTFLIGGGQDLDFAIAAANYWR